jgi:hypothetical protein
MYFDEEWDVSISPDIFDYPDSSYHAFADNPYPFPADERESYRLDALHDEYKILFGKNVLVPIEHAPRLQIVDLGTGSGMTTAFGVDDR